MCQTYLQASSSQGLSYILFQAKTECDWVIAEQMHIILLSVKPGIVFKKEFRAKPKCSSRKTTFSSYFSAGLVTWCPIDPLPDKKKADCSILPIILSSRSLTDPSGYLCVCLSSAFWNIGRRAWCAIRFTDGSPRCLGALSPQIGCYPSRPPPSLPFYPKEDKMPCFVQMYMRWNIERERRAAYYWIMICWYRCLYIPFQVL